MWLLLAQITGQVLYLVGCVLLLRLARKERRRTLEALERIEGEQLETLYKWCLANSNAHHMLGKVVYEVASRAGVLTESERQAWAEAQEVITRKTEGH